MIVKKIFSTLVLILIAGCGPIMMKQYSLPSGVPIVNVDLVALDKYHNSDTLELSIISRSSCSVKLVMAQIVSIGSQDTFDRGETQRAAVKLPAGELLNLNIYNESESGTKKISCSEAQAVFFEPGKHYALKVNNWSTIGVTQSGFGCKFRVVEVNGNGKEIRVLPLSQPHLPICAI